MLGCLASGCALNISFIICTYNRSSLLRLLLTGFSEDKVFLPDSEIIVVNNNSSDNTSEVVESFKAMLPIRECHEKQQGIIFARNRGLRESKGDNLVFLDDDILIEPRLVEVFASAFDTQFEIDYFGARLKPYWPEGKPNWVKDENLSLLRGLYGNHDYGSHNKRYQNDMDCPFGASFGIRRKVLDKIGIFNEDLSRGEETDLLNRANLSGSLGMYLGEVCSYHRVQNSNISLPSIYTTGKLAGRAHFDIYRSEEVRNWFTRMCNYVVKGSYQLLLGRGDRARQCLINIAMLIGQRQAIRGAMSSGDSKGL